MSEEEHKQDPDGSRLLANLFDKTDCYLHKHGLQFIFGKGIENAEEELRKYVFHFYEDITGGDSSYDPAKDRTPTGESYTETEETMSSETLETESTTDVEETATKKRRE